MNIISDIYNSIKQCCIHLTNNIRQCFSKFPLVKNKKPAIQQSLIQMNQIEFQDYLQSRENNKFKQRKNSNYEKIKDISKKIKSQSKMIKQYNHQNQINSDQKQYNKDNNPIRKKLFQKEKKQNKHKLRKSQSMYEYEDNIKKESNQEINFKKIRKTQQEFMVNKTEGIYSNKDTDSIIIKPINLNNHINQSFQARQSGTESFHTIRSNQSRPLSRRNFKVLSRDSSSLSVSSNRKNNLVYLNKGSLNSQTDQFYSMNESQNSSVGQGHIITKIKGFNQANNNNFAGQKGQNDLDNMQFNVQLMSQWFKTQYQKYQKIQLIKQIDPLNRNSKNRTKIKQNSLNALRKNIITNNKINLSEIIKMKLQTKSSFDNLVHKLQDYYTFYYQYQQNQGENNQRNSFSNDNIKNQINSTNNSFNYTAKNNQLICSLTMNNSTSNKISQFNYTNNFDPESNQTPKYTSLLIIPNCSLSPIKFLQWFNQIQIQSIIYEFNKIQYLETDNSLLNNNIKLEYPLVKCQQFSQNLQGKQVYTLARQIQLVKFQGQEQNTLLQTCFQALNEEKYYQRLIRITKQDKNKSNETIHIEIYTESSQKINLKRNINNFQLNEEIRNKNKQNQKEKEKTNLYQDYLLKTNSKLIGSSKYIQNEYPNQNNANQNNKINQFSPKNSPFSFKGSNTNNNHQTNLDNSNNKVYKYFQIHWKKFQERLNKDKIINKKIVNVYRN